MSKQTLTITLEADRKAELDSLAEARGRDRDALIDEALGNWLELHSWQTREIEAGLADAEASNFATETEIEAAYDNSWALLSAHEPAAKARERHRPPYDVLAARCKSGYYRLQSK